MDSKESPRLHECLRYALDQEATSIHIDVGTRRATCRIARDIFPLELYPPQELSLLVHTIKKHAQLDLEDTRLPQMGIFHFTHETLGKHQVDVSLSPGPFGEHLTLRFCPLVLRVEHSLEELGMDTRQLANWKKAIQKREGMILVTGSVFDGKNTTIYSTLLALQAMGRNIATIEKLPRNDLPGIHQTQINEDIGLNEGALLRSFQYADFDTIYVRELMDFETVQLAFREVLSHGNLLFSTLHTHSAAAAFARLLNMGFEPYLLAEAITLVQGQRRIRRLCDACKKPTHAEAQIFQRQGFLPEELETLQPFQFHMPVGCETCHQTGFRGSVLVCESLPVTQEIHNLVATAQHRHLRLNEEIEKLAVQQGMKTLKRHALEKAASGDLALKDFFLHFT